MSAAVSNTLYITGSSANGDLTTGLMLARTQQFSAANGDRLGAPNVAIIVTNGGGVAQTQVQNQLQLMKDAGITVFSVGMSGRIAEADLRALSSVPQLPNFNYFKSSSITSLSSFSSAVSAQVCQSASADCSGRVMDLVFMLTSSATVQQDNPATGWSNLINFVATLVQGMNIGSQATRVGVVTFGDSVQNVIFLNSYDSVGQLASAILSIPYVNRGTGHDIQYVLNTMRTQQFTSSQGDRPDAPNVAILITDSATTGSTVATVAEARLAQQAGIKIFTIGATSRINVTELQLIASQPHLQYHQWWTVDSLSPSATVGLSYIQTNVEKELCRPDYALSCGFTESDGYQCFCQWGYCDTRPMNGTDCQDVNECLINNGGCQQLCSNSPGSFSCSCGTGFVPTADGKGCNDVNECLGNPCTSGSCVNSLGSYYCLSTQAIASAQVSDSASGSGASSSGYPISTVVFAVLFSITTAILIIIVSVLVVRHVRSRQPTDEADLVTDATAAAPARVIGNLQSWGFSSIRSKFSIDSDVSSMGGEGDVPPNGQSPS
jgi:hypothetical protein